MNDKIQYAIRMINEMEYEQGIEILKDILTEDPKNDVALYNLALAYNSINEPENAINTFNLYLEHHEKDSNVLAGLGYSYYLNRDIEKAKEILEEAVELNPENIYALRNLSGVLANLGDTKKAEKLFKQILALNPEDYRSLTGLGMIYFQKEEYDKAETCFYQVMDLPVSEEAKDPAREYLTKLAEKTLKKDGFRVDAVMYLVSAINLFKNMDLAEIKKIAFEIATLGQNGLDINDPKKTYKIPALQGIEISGLCAEKKENRLMPYSDADTMRIAIREIEDKNTIDYPVETRKKLYPLWVHGIITQLTSMPEDARIEKWIFDNYPELWKSQQQALEKQSNDIQSVIGPEIKSMTPEFIYNASGIINLFYIKSINNIIGPAALKALKKTSFYEKGMEIYSGITEIMKKEDTLANSIEITNYLAKTLGFEEWFRWQDFENIPAGYEDAIAY